MKKNRLDEVLMASGDAKDRNNAFIFVTEGRVFVNGQKAISPSQPVSGDDQIEVRPPREFVGRGAYKLEAALKRFAVDVKGKICADIGAATGGFTEVLLKHGATKVYAIDVGRGKLDVKLRENPRVVVMEGMNVLDIENLWKSDFHRFYRNFLWKSDFLNIDVVTIDLSFTSLRLVLSKIRPWLSAEGSVVALFKPQYEIKDKSFLKHGVVHDAAVRERVIKDFRAWLAGHGWAELGFMESPIRGSEGNTEYLFYLQPG